MKITKTLSLTSLFLFDAKLISLIILGTIVIPTTLVARNNFYTVYAQDCATQTGTTNFSADGTIASSLGDFILVGPWKLDVMNGKVSDFKANITTVLRAGEKEHVHLMSNFQQDPGTKAELNINNTGTIKGTLNIGLNKKLDEWARVPTIISLKNGETISIVLNDSSKAYPASPLGPTTTAFAHFTANPNQNLDRYNAHNGPQPVDGIVRHLTRAYTITH